MEILETALYVQTALNLGEIVGAARYGHILTIWMVAPSYFNDVVPVAEMYDKF